jgi:hypothetical protein
MTSCSTKADPENILGIPLSRPRASLEEEVHYERLESVCSEILSGCKTDVLQLLECIC